MAGNGAKTDMEFVRLGLPRIEPDRLARRIVAGQLPRCLDFL